MKLSRALLGVIIVLAILPWGLVQAAQVVQVPMQKIFNARPVTTLHDTQLTTWNIGVDGDGLKNGYLTRAAAHFLGDSAPKALPDSALIPATSRHPAVRLHYDNRDSKSPQARYVRGQDAFSFAVPRGKYRQLFLFFTSAEGESELKVELQYADGSEVVSLLVPDYYADIAADDPVFFYLLHDLAKWDSSNNKVEDDHHNIDGAELHIDQNKVLTRVKIAKSPSGYLVFWGATGVLAQ